MAENTIGDVIVKIGANIEELQRGAKEAIGGMEESKAQSMLSTSPFWRWRELNSPSTPSASS